MAKDRNAHLVNNVTPKVRDGDPIWDFEPRINPNSSMPAISGSPEYEEIYIIDDIHSKSDDSFIERNLMAGAKHGYKEQNLVPALYQALSAVRIRARNDVNGTYNVPKWLIEAFEEVLDDYLGCFATDPKKEKDPRGDWAKNPKSYANDESTSYKKNPLKHYDMYMRNFARWSAVKFCTGELQTTWEKAPVIASDMLSSTPASAGTSSIISAYNTLNAQEWLFEPEYKILDTGEPMTDRLKLQACSTSINEEVG